jgi:hypothetical protein
MISIAAAFLALSTYCWFLNNSNERLVKENAQLVIIAKNKQDAAKQCSDNTDELVRVEKQNTENAKLAVEQAKKEAVRDYINANNILIRKPVQPKITAETANNFGGTDKDAQLKDYLSTHDLANEAIDTRKRK